ncbi:RING-H2 finger protein ATL52 [Arachis ipaensis]|uniref:RING-type E3 ubiquitin transferase n=2 Tax=Arachis hypogaea TaxID=3818 RepID=A0A444XGV3_ARAHY|nr:RING-H2 finger protein ATL52 [Arachis ipaensis]XP_025676783.1 RING-H2 finger protein ATL52-like [Arachis hypogaea]QHN76857.1 RING-H2 finger protein [Arachis hypogaea]RYQ88989.1 hypothetical protein Ahy_B09g095865 isoform A [Arachis hypogaea]
MGSLGDPRSWISYMNSKDCSLEWCHKHKLYPPPSTAPPNSRPNFSPLIIAMAGILATAFILASYYYSRRRENPNDDDDDSVHEAETWWHQYYVSTTTTTRIGGDLDEDALKWMAVWKYKSGKSRADSCCVCLNEFDEGDSVRALPNCTHAFHPLCIETWLKSHSSCPLCRRATAPVAPPYAVVEDLPLPAGTDTTTEEEEEESIHNNGNVDNNSLHRIIDIIRDDQLQVGGHDDDQSINKTIRKSVSMDPHSFSSSSSSSKSRYRSRGDQRSSKSCSCKRKHLLHSVFRGPIAMKRSFSGSARFSLITTASHTARH